MLVRQEVLVDVAHDPGIEGAGTPTAHR